jgi:hypothetical protein
VEIKVGFPRAKSLVKNWAKSVNSKFLILVKKILIMFDKRKKFWYNKLKIGKKEIFIMPRKNITKELKQEIINYYLSKPMTLKQVEDKYKLSHPTISKILKEIPKYTKAKIYNPNMKEHFFQEINSEENAYFLGLLIADGNIFKDNTGRQASISITLNLEDEYMLQKFKEVLRADTSIGYDNRGCGQIAVRSDIMAEDLAKYGVVPRKSYHTYLPEIPNQYM